jgi:hypothetical protein
MMYPETNPEFTPSLSRGRAVGIGVVLGILVSLLFAFASCVSPMQMTDDTIVVPDGGSIIISPDGSLLTVLDAHGALVWQGDPTK